VTLVGPPGVAKTRLAMEYLAEHGEGDGPWLVRLADWPTSANPTRSLRR